MKDVDQKAAEMFAAGESVNAVAKEAGDYLGGRQEAADGRSGAGRGVAGGETEARQATGGRERA